jgi:hypothetical protein
MDASVSITRYGFYHGFIFDATGARMRTAPYTPARVQAALARLQSHAPSGAKPPYWDWLIQRFTAPGHPLRSPERDSCSKSRIDHLPGLLMMRSRCFSPRKLSAYNQNGRTRSEFRT